MIIGIEAKRLFHNFSGLGNYSRNTVNLLSKFYPDNKYVLFAPILTDLYKTPENVQVITPQANISRRLRPYWRLYKVSGLLKPNKIDIYHGLSNVLPFGLKKSGVPSVLTIHDLIFLRFPAFYKKIDRMLYRFFTIRSCHRATKILAISQQTKTDLIDLLGIDAGKIEVVYQSCDKRYYEKVEEELKQAVRLKFNLPEKFILCVGTIEQRKNQLAILEGMVQEKLDIPIVLVGKPTEYKKQLDEFIFESDIRKQLIFLHQTNSDELQAIYQMAEIMVYPSFFEGFGLPVLEAQASGCPVITSNISSLPEAGGDAALYVDPSNSQEIGLAIKKILTDNDLKNELIQKGYVHSRKFNDQAVAANLMKLYQSLVSVTI